MLFRHKGIFWVSLTLLIYAFFQWLFGITVPGIALEFAIGTTAVLMMGLLLGNMLTALAIRRGGLRNMPMAILGSGGFVVFGFVVVAFLLNAMIEKTTLFPFALTVLMLFLTTAAAACFITVVRHQYKVKINVAQAAVAQTKSELRLLQSQMSPHFLFNTLNNLYGLSMAEPSRVPPLILKLSDLLRYAVYEAKETYVPLEDEVAYLCNYLEFERLRLGERLQLSTDIATGTDLNIKVPPMMFIVFLENAFKHSRTTGGELITIDIGLSLMGTRLMFHVKNSMAAESVRDRPPKHSGFGLDSVKKRLDLLYPGKHTLQIRKGLNDYAVYLELECR